MRGLNTNWHQDAKLTTAQRKKLKSSTFCGPNRSFPVPDCAHVTAARRLLGRAKVSESTKAKISACVSRKAKQLGCGPSKDSDDDIEKLIASEAFDDTREFLAFHEAVAKDLSPDEETVERLLESSSKLLDKLRSKRLNIESSDSRVQEYMARSLNSLFDSILDELNA